MIRKGTYLLLLLSLLLQGTIGANAQFYSTGDDPHVRWRKIKTEHYTFIYPEEIDSLARRYASLFETNRARVMESLEINPKRIPVVLHPYITRSNGVVTWAPKRVDIFTTPPAYSSTSEPWDYNVSIHESRHIGQISHYENGVFKVLYPLIGEQSTGIGVGLYPSKSFLEGDAVIAETELSNAGRGRNADFMMYMRAAYLNGDFRDWDRWTFGSYKYYTPDHYTIGYITNSTARVLGSGYHAPSALLRYQVKHFYDPNVIFNSFHSISFQSKQMLLEEGHHYLSQMWKEELSTLGRLTEGERFNTQKNRLYTDYRYPIYIDDPLSKYYKCVIAVKKGFERASSLVAIDSSGREKILRPFSYYSSPLSLSKDGHIYWSESSYNGPNTLQDNSVIGTYELQKGKFEILHHHTRYFNPTPTPKGDEIVVVEYPVSGSSYIVYLSSEGQVVKQRIEAPHKGQIKESAFVGEILYCSIILDKGLAIYSFNRSLNKWKEVIPQQNQTITGLKGFGENLIFTSDLSGVNNIYAYNTSNSTLYKLTNALYGASDGYIYNDRLYYSEFDTQGYHLATNLLDSLYWAESDFTKPYKYKVAEILAQQAKEETRIDSTQFVDVTDTIKYPSKKYGKLSHLFRVHSWAPVYYNVDKIMSMSYESFYDIATLGFTLYSQNTLSTATTMLGYSYHQGFHSAHTSFEYTGLGVAFKLGLDYNDRNRISLKIEKNDANIPYPKPTSHMHSPFLSTYFLAYYPWIMSRGGWQRSFVPQFQWTFTNDSYYSSLESKYLYKHQFNYGFTYSQTLPITPSGYFPRWGFGLRVLGASAPFTAENFGSMIYANGYFYLPGITPQQGLKLTASIQKQNVDGKRYYLSGYASMPRGYTSERPTTLFSKATLDYAIPIYLGDYNLWSILYFKRMTIIPFADGAINIHDISLGYIPYYSFGADILFDIYPLRFDVPVSIGMRYARTGPKGEGGSPNYFDFLFKIDLP